MLRHFVGIFVSLFVVSFSVNAQLPHVSAGSIKRIENFQSAYVKARNIDVWLPKNYSPQKKYPVLYMQDGISLFDSALMWNHQEWGVDEWMSKLISEKKIRQCIVVGIPNAGIQRHNEYMPLTPFTFLSKTEQENIFKARRANGNLVFEEPKIISDHYLKFVVTELKPYIDSTFSTLKNAQNTFIAGSSMGGMISLYAICEYPQVFGGAACLSTHWTCIFTEKDNPVPAAMMKYLTNNLPDPKTHKIYFDHGTATLDTLYQPFQLMADKIMVSKGYSSFNWITKEFIGADHSENAWNKRLNIPLEFLLGNNNN